LRLDAELRSPARFEHSTNHRTFVDSSRIVGFLG